MELTKCELYDFALQASKMIIIYVSDFFFVNLPNDNSYYILFCLAGLHILFNTQSALFSSYRLLENSRKMTVNIILISFMVAKKTMKFLNQFLIDNTIKNADQLF